VATVLLPTILFFSSIETVTIVGPVEGGVDEAIELAAIVSGGDSVDYTWSIESGPGIVTASGSSAVIESSGIGDVVVKVVAGDSVCGSSAEDTHTITIAHVDGFQKPNDINGDGNLDISDPVALLSHLFSGTEGPCEDHPISHELRLAMLDANGSGEIDISDPVYVLNFLFLGGPKPVNCADVTCPCFLTPGSGCAAIPGCGA
jgi:hypothetical protein